MADDWESIAAAWERAVEDYLNRRVPAGSWRQVGEVRSWIAPGPDGVDAEIFLIHGGLAKVSADHGRYVLVATVQYEEDLEDVARELAEIAVVLSKGPVRHRDRFWGEELSCDVGGEVVSLPLMRPHRGFLPTLYPRPCRARDESSPL